MLGITGIAAIGMVCGSCGKVRDFVNKAKRTTEAEASTSSDAGKKAGSTPDPLLQALVDQTAEGVVFRKDLAFPEQVQVKVERRHTFESARVVVKSALGDQVASISGTRFWITHFERAGNQVTLTMESAGFDNPVASTAEAEQAVADKKNADKEKAAAAKGNKSKDNKGKLDKPPVTLGTVVPDELFQAKDLTGGKISFTRSGKLWKAKRSGDFKSIAWGSNLESGMGATCVDAGVLPRSHWFGKGRLKPGDSVPLSGAALPLLLGEGAKGALTLKLETFEASGGHPCGVFSVTGSYHAAAVPGLDGEPVDSDVSISSGKIWVSLIYPVVIRESLETVQTLVTGAGSGHSTRIQGTVSVTVNREWKTPGAAPE